MMLVRNTGCTFTRRLSTSAASLSRPRRRCAKNVVRMCTASATARVMIIENDPAEGGVSRNPSQPAMPSPVTTDSPTSAMAQTMPMNERSSTSITTTMTPTMIGTSVTMSCLLASRNALSSMTRPVRRTSICG